MTMRNIPKSIQVVIGTVCTAVILCLSLLPNGHAQDKRVVILPLVFFADESKAYLRQGIQSMLVSRLSGEGLTVVSEEAYASFLREGEKKQGINSEERAQELAKLIQADYAIFGSVTSVGTGYSLDLAILDINKDPPESTKVSEAVSEDELITKLDDVAYDFRAVIAGLDIRKEVAPAAPAEEVRGKSALFQPSETYGFSPTGRFPAKLSIMSLDTGDLDGDGKSEILVLGRSDLLIYNRKGEILELKGKLEASFSEDFLMVSAGDMDKNGKAEVYIVSYSGSTAYSSVWEWTGKFKRLERLAGHLRVAKDYGGGSPLLLYLGSSVNSFYSGKLCTMDYEGGKFVKKESLPGLEDAQFYTLTLFDLDQNGTQEFLGLGDPGLDESSRIFVWNRKGEVLWRSDEQVGGTNNAIRWGTTYTDGGADQPPRIVLNSRLVVTDIDGDGKKEILAVKNIPLVKYIDFKLYIKANLAAYRPVADGLVEAYKTRTINYCITDMQVDGKTLYLAGQKGQIKKFGEGTGRIMWFE